MDKIKDQTRLVQNPDIVLREEEENAALLFEPNTGAIHILNGTALAVWSRLDGSQAVSQILAELSEIYDMDSDAADDVRHLLANLLEINAVQLVDGDGS